MLTLQLAHVPNKDYDEFAFNEESFPKEGPSWIA
jgi:hypothetical protein